MSAWTPMVLYGLLTVALAFASGLAIAADEKADQKPAASSVPAGLGSTRVDFVRDVAPIFAEHCTTCHGSDAQQGGLRLDARKSVFGGGLTGPAVIAGSADKSLLLHRIRGEGGLDRMPLDDDPLSQDEIDRIEAWIEQGADWPQSFGSTAESVRSHWAYLKPVRPPIPSVRNHERLRTAIDAFIQARMEDKGLTFSPEASKEQLLRRVTLDLTGLPPTLNEIDAFWADDSPAAYEAVVDRLLASPAYGERWATPWLDAARYTDSNGYQRDGRRVYWAYRDWVIRALNADMPFDRFTVEQIAGDLLPNPTVEQLVATGFHRGTMANVEAGTDPHEERVLAVIDRVNTTASVWLGTTLECAQCHNHKYDPFSQTDYYRFFAFFNNTDTEIEVVGGEGSKREMVGPKIAIPETAEQQRRRDELKQSIDRLTEQQKTLPAKSNGDSKLELELKALREEYADAVMPTSLVMKELAEPRMTHVLKRGDFLRPGAPVQPGTPTVLHPLSADGAPNRAALAQWLIDGDNPLVARVTVNRHWAELFGRGLVTTIEDFGTRGQRPSHPELLDWLATEFIRQGWSIKTLHRLIVTSTVYRQSSRVTAALLEADRTNAYYTRAPRRRLTAEHIRDNALAVAGLLSGKMHGPPVFPMQPDGIWYHAGVANNVWTTSSGEDLYRRGLYIYWRRTVPYPSLVTFDAPSREVCSVQRSYSTTPLQALTLLNDPVYFEAAAALAARMMTEPKASVSLDDRIAYGFRLATSRKPTAAEREILANRFLQEKRRFQESPEKLTALLATHPSPNGADKLQYAGWICVANVLLNLDESIVKN
ncbi:MAG: DUF1553 domain-containing protein [Planctomycetaceae bacterium]